MTARTCVERRVLALLATAADGRTTDVDALLDDLDPDDLGDVVYGLASLAVGVFMPRGTDRQDPDQRTRIANALRADLLQWSADESADGQ
ncbi:hypothetical protein [Kitasatospora sp. NPDC001527]|uniref:hypothetical protein n=1 Tax=Kitasatospora sp. NPDC001527 TaxID=3154519 RepID=UPI003317CF60